MATTTDNNTKNNNMDASSLEKIQESYLGRHFKEYKDGSKDNDAGGASQVNSCYLDSLITQEFTKLSVQEREKSYEELHGVSDVVDETPELLSESLAAMCIELGRIATKDAYLQAEKESRDYVTDTKFRLAFLRAENFDATKAARRLVGFMEGKLQYFGEALLTKRIHFSDLEKDDQEFLKKGQMQILPSRDRGGRPIYCDMNMLKDSCYKRPVNRLKAFIYILLTLAEDEENQKRGFVSVLMQLGSIHPRDVNTELAKESPRIIKWIPLRVSAVHFCNEDPVLDFLARITLVAMPSESRSRHRMHKGTHTELLYSLLSFGIPIDLFPMNGESIIKKTNHNRWIFRRKIKESILEMGEDERPRDFKGIDLPTRQDILIGKGKPIQMHTGNIKLRLLVDGHLAEYQSTKRGKKAAVVTKVVDAIKAASGRFLEKDRSGWWNEVSDDEAYDKVYKAFLSAAPKGKQHDRAGLKNHHQHSCDEESSPLPVGTISSDLVAFQPAEKRQKSGATNDHFSLFS